MTDQAIASIINSVVLGIIGIVFVYKNSKSKAASEMHIEKKTKVYKEYIEKYMSVFSSGEKQKTQDDIKKITKDLLL
jgi:hypothetical protein